MVNSIHLNMKFVTLNEYINAERSSKFKGAKIKKQQTRMVKLIALSERFKLDCKKYDVEFIWYKPNNKIDHDNIAFAKKFIFDGLQDAGSLKGDGPKNINNFSDYFRLDKSKDYIHCMVIFNEVEL